jgi:hypothetical protein
MIIKVSRLPMQLLTICELWLGPPDLHANEGIWLAAERNGK